MSKILNLTCDLVIKQMFCLAATSRGEKGLMLAALHNIRLGGVSHVLQALIWGKTNDKDDLQLRVAALDAAGWEVVLSGRGLQYLMPIFADKSLSHELRIGALNLIMHTKPNAARIASLVNMLFDEPDIEVLNYAATLLETWAESQDPCERRTANLVKQFKRYFKELSQYEPNYGFGISKTYLRQFYSERHSYEGSYRSYIIGSPTTLGPLSFGTTMSSTVMNSQKSSHFNIHIRVEGLAKSLIRHMKSHDSTVWKLDDLANILRSEMVIKERPDEPIRLQVTFKFKGTIVLNYYRSEKNVGGWKPEDVLEALSELNDVSYALNSHQLLPLGGIIYEQPTPIGISLATTTRGSTLSSFKGAYDRGSSLGRISQMVNFDVSMFAQSMAATFIRHPYSGAAYGIKKDMLYHFRTPGQFGASVNVLKKELKLSVSRPPYERPLIALAHSQASVFVRGKGMYGSYEGLKNNCATCENRAILSRGLSFARNLELADWESTRYGFKFLTKYFNCETGLKKTALFKKMFETIASNGITEVTNVPQKLG